MRYNISEQEILYRCISKNYAIIEEFSTYMSIEQVELSEFLDKKKELYQYIVDKVDVADEVLRDAILKGVPYPKESMRRVLYNGIENSICEYVESMIREVPLFYNELQYAQNYDEIVSDLIKKCVPIFYAYLNDSYDCIMDKLDKELIEYISKQYKKYNIVRKVEELRPYRVKEICEILLFESMSENEAVISNELPF